MARTPKFYRFNNPYLASTGYAEYSGTSDGTAAAPYKTLAQLRTDWAAGSRIIIDPRSVIGVGYNGGSTSSELWLPDNGFGAISPTNGATWERWDVGDAWDAYEFTFDSFVYIASGSWAHQGAGVWKANVAWNQSGSTFGMPYGGKQLGDACNNLIPMRECGNLADLSAVDVQIGDWYKVANTTTTDVYVYNGSTTVTPTTYWSGFAIHCGATTGQTALWLRNVKRLHIKEHLLRMAGGGFSLRPGNTVGTDVEDIRIDSLTHRGGCRDGIAIGPSNVATTVKRVRVAKFDGNVFPHVTLERKNLGKEVNTQNGITVAGQALDVDLVDCNAKGYAHGTYNIFTNPAGTFGFPSADNTWPRRIDIYTTTRSGQYGLCDCGNTNYARGFTITVMGGAKISGQRILNQSITSQLSGNVWCGDNYFGPMRSFVNPLGSSDYGGGNHLTLYDATDYTVTDVKVVNNVFDQPWNYCMAIQYSVPANKAVVTRNLFIETTAGWARKEHVAESSSFATAGAFIIQYGNASGNVANFQTMRDNVGIRPAGQTTFALKKATGTRTYTALTDNDGTSGGSMAGNVVSDSMVNIGYDATTFKRQLSSATNFMGGPLLATVRFRGDPPHSGYF